MNFWNGGGRETKKRKTPRGRGNPADPAVGRVEPPADPPAPEPAPISVGVAEQYDPAGLESLLRQVLGSVDGLKKTVQASQVLTGVQEVPTGADALRTATMHAAGVFEPPAKK